MDYHHNPSGVSGFKMMFHKIILALCCSGTQCMNYSSEELEDSDSTESYEKGYDKFPDGVDISENSTFFKDQNIGEASIGPIFFLMLVWKQPLK